MQTNLTDKPWYRSKKYLAFLTMEILLAGLAALALVKQPELGWPLASFMVAIVVTMGAVAFGFNLTQSAMDKYLRGMALSLEDKPSPMLEKLLKEREPDSLGPYDEYDHDRPGTYAQEEGRDHEI